MAGLVQGFHALGGGAVDGEVEVVEAYRTRPVAPGEEVRTAIAAADFEVKGGQVPKGIMPNGGNVFYGLIFSNDAQTDDLGTGSAQIYGAQVSCRGYRNNGNGTLTYDAEALKNARRLTSVMVRVPGSWRDFRSNADTLP